MLAHSIKIRLTDISRLLDSGTIHFPVQLTKTHGRYTGGIGINRRKWRGGRTFDFVVQCNTSLLGLPVAR